MVRYLQVLLPFAFDQPFDYAFEGTETLPVGSYVEVPFGKKTVFGVVWSEGQPAIDVKKIKPIIRVSDAPPMKKELRDLIAWTAGYSLAPMGNVLAMAMSVKEALSAGKKTTIYRLAEECEAQKMTVGRQKIAAFLKGGKAASASEMIDLIGVSRSVIFGMESAGMLVAEEVNVPFYEGGYKLEVPEKLPIVLSGEQQQAVDHLHDKVKAGEFSVTLLDGITGSGKTEVYSAAILKVLQMGKQALILLPEIVLTTQLVERLEKNFGFTPTLWHSALTPKQRKENWKRICMGDAKLIVGARSALYLPYAKLGMIVVDEEHEASYKQEEGVIYHGRDMAVVRASLEKLPCVLVSASPSVETAYNVQLGKFEEIQLRSRHGGSVLPDIEVVDMRLENLTASEWLSSVMKQEIAERMSCNEQSLLFLNRRGYAPLTLCRKCGYRFQCPQCAAWLVDHRYPPHLQCHQCGYSERVPHQCPECESEGTLAPCGPGVERLEEEVRLAFPQARIAVMTSDTTAQPSAVENILQKIHAREVDIIIGTQMVAKGHHFPHLSLVGVVDADMGLEGGDLRAAERSFQLLQQVSGRAGREKTKGKAIIQSYMPENMVIDALKGSDRDQFIANELKIRQQAGVTPFGRMAAIVISGKEEAKTREFVLDFARFAPQGEGVRILGPSPAPLSQLRGMYRFRLLVITARNIKIQKLLSAWLEECPVPRMYKVKVDVDPYSFL